MASSGSITIPGVVVVLSVSSRPWGGPGASEKWDVTFDGAPLVSRCRDPEHVACRALLAMGARGRVLFIHAATGTPGLAMDIEAGAALTTVEDEEGFHTRKYRPFSGDGFTTAGKEPPSAVTLPGDDPDAVGEENADPETESPS